MLLKQKIHDAIKDVNANLEASHKKLNDLKKYLNESQSNEREKEVVVEANIALASVKSLDLEKISLEDLSVLNLRLNSVAASLESLNRFGVHQTPANRSDIFDTFENAVHEVSTHTKRVRIFIGQDVSQTEAAIREANKAIERITKVTAEIEKVQKQATETFDKFMEKMKELSRDATDAAIAKFFFDRATLDRRWAYLWLGVSCSMIVGILILFLVYYLNPIIDESEKFSENISAFYVTTNVSFRAFTFSVLLVAFFVFIRLYRSQVHSFSVNMHRANTLMTFRSFLAEENEPETRKVVAIHAANAAFSPRATGFEASGKDVAPASLGTDVIVNTMNEASK